MLFDFHNIFQEHTDVIPRRITCIIKQILITNNQCSRNTHILINRCCALCISYNSITHCIEFHRYSKQIFKVMNYSLKIGIKCIYSTISITLLLIQYMVYSLEYINRLKHSPIAYNIYTYNCCAYGIYNKSEIHKYGKVLHEFT